MQTISPRRTRKDRLSVSVVPEESVDTAFRCPHLRLLFGEQRSADLYPDIRCDSCRDDQVDADDTENNAAIGREVADWLELQERDSTLTPRQIQLKKLLPSANEAATLLATRLDAPNPNAAYVGSMTSDALVHFVALQLLASCYTVFPASSAESLPILQQRTRGTVVTALRVHWHYHFSPAAGHHAREPSETSPWPGLYTAPSSEDQSAETVTKRWKLDKAPVEVSQGNPRPNTTDWEPTEMRSFRGSSKASRWSDGPAPTPSPEELSPSPGRSRIGSNSSSSSQRGLLHKFMCQPQRPRHAQPKRHKSFLDHLSSLPKAIPSISKQVSRASDKSKKKTPIAKKIPNVPAVLVRRRTQSVPRKSSKGISAVKEPPPILRRTSSTPSFSARHTHAQGPIEIPEIRRISASTAAQDTPSIANAEQLCLDEMKLSPNPMTNPWTATRYASTSSNPISPKTDEPFTTAPPRPSLQDDDYFSGWVPVGGKRPDPTYSANYGWGEQSKPTTEPKGPAAVTAHAPQHDSWSSEDSIDIMDKRKGHVFEAKEFGSEASGPRESGEKRGKHKEKGAPSLTY